MMSVMTIFRQLTEASSPLRDTDTARYTSFESENRGENVLLNGIGVEFRMSFLITQWRRISPRCLGLRYSRVGSVQYLHHRAQFPAFGQASL